MGAHQHHSYAVQTMAFYLSLAPGLVLIAAVFAGRYLDGLRRVRKPRPLRPAILKAQFAVPRVLLSSAE